MPSLRTRQPAWKTGQKRGCAPKLVTEIQNDKTYLLQPWHHGEPKRSWWLDLDRSGFTAQAKKEQTRIEASSMAIRITRKENT